MIAFTALEVSREMNSTFVTEAGALRIERSVTESARLELDLFPPLVLCAHLGWIVFGMVIFGVVRATLIVGRNGLLGDKKAACVS